jgi:hypothetical protein
MTTEDQQKLASSPGPGRDFARVNPPVPRVRTGKLAIAMAFIGTIVVGGYAAAAYTNFEPLRPARDELPAGVRNSPGGYRSYSTWHRGYQGGK